MLYKIVFKHLILLHRKEFKSFSFYVAFSFQWLCQIWAFSAMDTDFLLLKLLSKYYPAFVSHPAVKNILALQVSSETLPTMKSPEKTLRARVALEPAPLQLFRSERGNFHFLKLVPPSKISKQKCRGCPRGESGGGVQTGKFCTDRWAALSHVTALGLCITGA